MSFTCPICQWTSAHPMDEWHGYCGNCGDYTEPRSPCRIEVLHPKHTWHPTLTDLDAHVIHLRLDVDLICPGYPPPVGAQ